MTSDVTYTSDPVVDAETAAAVRRLIDRAEEYDGAEPISEHQLLRLTNSSADAPWRHVIAWVDAESGSAGTVAGYAIVDPSTTTPEAELVVDPTHRRAGIGSELLRVAREVSGSRATLVWSHGTSDGSQLFAASQHAEATRILWQLRRPSGPLEDVPLPDGITLRSFEPGDADGWVAVNAAAFSSHPEQGSWTLDDLAARQGEPWFDADGFLIAEAGPNGAGKVGPGEIAGFHWTKIHGPSTSELTADPNLAAKALGEVYVVGVDPRAQGLGLGRALTVAGLRHLQDRGIPEVLLYVDDSNTPAVQLYRDLGFTEFSRDTQYRLT